MYIKIPIRYTVYNNCPRAARMNALGSLLIVFGIPTVFAVIGIFLIIWGVSLKSRSKSVAADESFDYWMGELQEKGILLKIPENRELALDMCKANPSLNTLEYLRMANPEAVKVIESGPVFSTGN